MKILSITPHKRVSYTPGLISLILLPVLCLVFLHQQKKFKHTGVLDIGIVDPDIGRIMAKKYHFKIPPERNYAKVNFNGSISGDKSLLDFAKLEIKNMICTKSRTLGLQLHFGAHAKYQTFVSVIDMCSADALTWVPIQDDIYVYYTKR
ncbi:hypothetical protein LX99_00263 [Mucilaginibacter oryzae]|uniref:Uncharacterized protein n=1 Tax=Mucilaginibacter oryzae TaxID=468058 RepID=A0A316HI38_9SPHI|nr:hypothetical protein [Mucilaginibacter oryzae]PWK79803.1 hypothetical protein LX99_00263 [Mucilaginibacter oryzae]